jgi:DNA-binding transcriptional LysR family regulator
MDLWQLNVFCKVVEKKSFSKAGEAVNLSQPTVSSHIKYLENHFDCRLIDRLGKKALPTRAGLLLYNHAIKLLADRDKLETALADFKGVARGRITIGGSTIPGNHILPEVLGPFLGMYPEVTVLLKIGDTQAIINHIIAGDLEFGLVGAETSDSRLTQERLVEDEMKLIVPAAHPWAKRRRVGIDSLAREPFIGREQGSGTLTSVGKALTAAGSGIEKLRIIAELGSTTAVCQGIKHGIGISILSPIAVREELNAGTLAALSVDRINLKRSFYLTRHRKRTLSPLGSLFSKYLKQAVKRRKKTSPG